MSMPLGRCALALLCWTGLGCSAGDEQTRGTRSLDQDRDNSQSSPITFLGVYDSSVDRGPTTPHATVPKPHPTDAGLLGLDAATPDGGATSDSGVDASTSAYACQQNLDCTVKDVGSCCGYLPRCANVSANFAPPDCSHGQIGVCSLPFIDHCECRQNLCVDVQVAHQP